MEDKRGDPCGYWFRDIVVPLDMGIKDTKDCVVFKKTDNIHFFLCSVEKYRAFYAIKMIIRKMWSTCHRIANELSANGG